VYGLLSIESILSADSTNRLARDCGRLTDLLHRAHFPPDSALPRWVNYEPRRQPRVGAFFVSVQMGQCVECRDGEHGFLFGLHDHTYRSHIRFHHLAW
jgi:hypothetical protein